jgi:hypothetical protein
MKISTLAKILNEVIAEKQISFHRFTFNQVVKWLRENFATCKTVKAARAEISNTIELGLFPQ